MSYLIYLIAQRRWTGPANHVAVSRCVLKTDPKKMMRAIMR